MGLKDFTSGAHLMEMSMTPSKGYQMVWGAHLRLGAVLEGIEIDRVEFDNCSTQIASSLDQRPIIRNVTLRRVKARSSHLAGAILEDVVLDRCHALLSAGFIRGCEFRRVRIQGRVKGLSIQKKMYVSDDKDIEALYNEASRVEPDDGSWSLDIRDMLGDVDIRGYAPRRILRNPEHQAVMTRKQALDGAWRKVDLAGTVFSVHIDHLLHYADWEGVILAGNPVGKEFDTQRRVIDDLRAAGAINPD